jgi:hypothetical protein
LSLNGLNITNALRPFIEQSARMMALAILEKPGQEDSEAVITLRLEPRFSTSAVAQVKE